MGTIKATVEHINDDAMRVTWLNMAATDIGEAFSGMHEYADRSVSVFQGGGSGFNGGTITIQGSPNFVKDGIGAFWSTLNSPSETPLLITSDKIRGVLEYVESIRPLAGAGIDNVTVILNCKRLRRG